MTENVIMGVIGIVVAILALGKSITAADKGTVQQLTAALLNQLQAQETRLDEQVKTLDEVRKHLLGVQEKHFDCELKWTRLHLEHEQTVAGWKRDIATMNQRIKEMDRRKIACPLVSVTPAEELELACKQIIDEEPGPK